MVISTCSSDVHAWHFELFALYVCRLGAWAVAAISWILEDSDERGVRAACGERAARNPTPARQSTARLGHTSKYDGCRYGTTMYSKRYGYCCQSVKLICTADSEVCMARLAPPCVSQRRSTSQSPTPGCALALQTSSKAMCAAQVKVAFQSCLNSCRPM